MDPLAFLFTFLLSITHLTSFAAATEEDQFVYSGFSSSNLILNGTAMVTPDGVLELTNGTIYSKGYAFHPTSWQFRRSPDGAVQPFSISFVFSMASADFNGCPNSMAFLIFPGDNLLSALNSTSLDLNKLSILTVELDTCQKYSTFQEDNENDISVFIDKSPSSVQYPAGFWIFFNPPAGKCMPSPVHEQ